MTSQNDLAKAFKALHKPGNPIILTNVWDAIIARTVASLPGTKALATASYAVAAAAGLSDDDLTLSENLRAIRTISPIAQEFHLPLTVDFQDGFGSSLEDGVRELLHLGAVGLNIEDFSREKKGLYDVVEAQERIKTILLVARECGVPDFVVNARSDALMSQGDLEETIRRGKAYLEAGATTVFILGGQHTWTREEVKRATEELGGRLNVSLLRRKGGLSVRELSEIGVARISLGPQLMFGVRGYVESEARKILAGEGM